MSNLAIGQNFAKEQGNQLITDNLLAVECIQWGTETGKWSPAACVQIYLSKKKKSPSHQKKQKQKPEEQTTTSKANKKFKGHSSASFLLLFLQNTSVYLIDPEPRDGNKQINHWHVPWCPSSWHPLMVFIWVWKSHGHRCSWCGIPLVPHKGLRATAWR